MSKPRVDECGLNRFDRSVSVAFSGVAAICGLRPMPTDPEIRPPSYVTAYGLRYTGRVLMALASASPEKLPEAES